MKRQKGLLLLLLALLSVTMMADGYQPMRRRMCRTGHRKVQTEARHRAAAAADSATAVQYLGNRRQLVVLVAFSDKGFSKESATESAQDTEVRTLRIWNRIFNEEHFNEAPFFGSVHDYFHDQSYGRLNLQFDLQYVVLGDSCAKYKSTDFDDENSKYLVQDVVEVLEQRHIDWTPYDWNNNGEVNQLLMVYAGQGMNDSREPNLIWPHQGWLSEHEDCQSIVVGTDGAQRVVDSYCCVQEQTSSKTYGVFGTICHEFSHCLGLPDIYYGNTTFLDHWDLMDSGNYNDGGFRPCGYSAFERMEMGWITPNELTEPVSITGMNALATHPEAYIIRNDSCRDEYYVVENRQQVSWDEPLPGSGIIIFHVNYNPEWKRYEMPNVPNRSKNLYIIAANNTVLAPPSYQKLKELDGWGYPYEDNDSLTNNSAPASVTINPCVGGQKLMSKPIYNMAVTDGLASFSFMKRDAPSAITTPASSAPKGTYTILYTLGNIAIVRYANGAVRKIMR